MIRIRVSLDSVMEHSKEKISTAQALVGVEANALLCNLVCIHKMGDVLVPIVVGNTNVAVQEITNDGKGFEDGWRVFFSVLRGRRWWCRIRRGGRNNKGWCDRSVM